MGEQLKTIPKGRILVMDDEDVILEVVSDILTMDGYEVDGAGGGHEAVNLYEAAMEEKEPYDLVLMDLSVPGGEGGGDAVADLLAIDPDARAVALSGNPNDPVIVDYWKYGFKDVILKPCTSTELIEVVRRVLEGVGP